MEKESCQRSNRYLEPYLGESISHYLGRWMNQESVSISKSSSLSKQLGLGKTLWRWERFYFNPRPSEEELRILAEIMELEGEKLRLLFPPRGETINPEPIRLCAACYREKPYHQIGWQFQSTAGCEIHRLRLLSRCVRCGERFPLPVEWKGKCKRCRMDFKSMRKRQKHY